jgi:zona occludens toxin
LALNLYTGKPAAGKTFEVVANVIVPAIAAGRRVVSNIDGLNFEKICEYIMAKGLMGKLPMGEIVLVDTKQIQGNAFFCNSQDDVSSVVRAGDCVVLDETWRFWGKGDYISKEAMSFFREHRHWVSPQGFTTDIVLISQLARDLNPMIRGIAQASFNMHKKSSLGMDKTYSVSVWDGGEQLKYTRLRTELHKYNPEIFPLYKSHQVSGAREVQTDKRVNILNSTYFRFLFFVVPVLMGLCIWGVVHIFHSGFGTKKEMAVVVEKNEHSKRPPVVLGVRDDAIISSSMELSPWRISGLAVTRGHSWVVLVSSGLRPRYESPALFTFMDGVPVFGVIEGKRVTTYSGGGGSSIFAGGGNGHTH